jgi:uncharacterized integral membrane protein (TIGR00697 family)
MKSNFKLNLLFGLFTGLLVAMNLLGIKTILTPFWGAEVSVAIFMAPLTFLITDIVEEVYGRKLTGQFIAIGVITLLILAIYNLLFVWLPVGEKTAYLEPSYQEVFRKTPRMILASLSAFALAQLNDRWLFAWIKTKTKGKMLWLRNNLSTIVSQFIDTFVFMLIAFWGTSDTFTLKYVFWGMTIPYYLFKVAFAFLDTPLVYLGVKWLRRSKEESD